MQSEHQSLYQFMVNFRNSKKRIAIARGDHEISFQSFYNRIDKVAGSLKKLGIKSGDVVLIALPNIEQSPIASYAVSKLGAIASMVHPLVSLSAFEKIVKEHKPSVIFLSDINYKTFKKACGNAKVIFCPYLLDVFVGLPYAKPLKEAATQTGEETIFYLQSGGTSGEPKTIELSSRSANAMVNSLLEELGEDYAIHLNAMLVVMPMFHGFGLCVGMHTMLCNGSTVVLLPQYSSKKLTKLCHKYSVTALLAIPRMVAKLLEYDKFNDDYLPSLKHIFVGGDTVSKELVQSFQQKLKHTQILPGYGLTETVTVCVLNNPDYVVGSVGKPLPRVECIVLDENLHEVEPNQVGELYISSNQTMNGYLHDEKATQETLVTIQNKTYVKTGDLFKKDSDGNLYFIGRKKRLIKISGMNIFPSEIEDIAKQLKLFNECVAIECTIQNKTYIRLLVEGQLDDNQKNILMSHIKKNMSHWNYPRDIICIDEFPRTKVGKIDIVQLQNDYKN